MSSLRSLFLGNRHAPRCRATQTKEQFTTEKHENKQHRKNGTTDLDGGYHHIPGVVAPACPNAGRTTRRRSRGCNGPSHCEFRWCGHKLHRLPNSDRFGECENSTQCGSL